MPASQRDLNESGLRFRSPSVIKISPTAWSHTVRPVSIQDNKCRGKCVEECSVTASVLTSIFISVVSARKEPVDHQAAACGRRAAAPGGGGGVGSDVLQVR